MPADPISTQLLICERVLKEEDGVLSVIRIVDVFNIVSKPHIPPQERPINLSILFSARFPSGDDTEHKVVIKLERPSGEVVDVGEGGPAKLPPTKYPGTPSALNVPARFGVFPLMMGTHHIIVVLDDKHTERVPFTLREQVSGKADPDPDQG